MPQSLGSAHHLLPALTRTLRQGRSTTSSPPRLRPLPLVLTLLPGTRVLPTSCTSLVEDFRYPLPDHRPLEYTDGSCGTTHLEIHHTTQLELADCEVMIGSRSPNSSLGPSNPAKKWELYIMTVTTLFRLYPYPTAPARRRSRNIHEHFTTSYSQSRESL